MITVSVSLSDGILQQIDRLIVSDIVSSREDAICEAVKEYLENQAVESVLRASKESTL
jgi:metal-responsive CopG/Arc/MetJ family transcriptional regulator